MQRRSVTVLAIALVLLTAGCRPVRGGSPDRTSDNSGEGAFTTSTVGAIKVKWTFREAAGSTEPDVTSAVVSDGGVHVGAWTDTGYRLFALDPATGDVRWSQLL